MELTREQISQIAYAVPSEVAVYQVGDSVKTLYVSEGMSTLSGISEEQYSERVRDDALTAVIPFDKPLLEDAIDKTVNDGEEVEIAYRVMNSEQNWSWLRGRTRLIGTLEGLPVVLVLFADTERGNARLAEVIEHSTSATYIVDLQTREMLYANRECVSLFGRAPRPGETCYAYRHDASEPCEWCPLAEMEGRTARLDDFHQIDNDRWYQYNYLKIDWFGRSSCAIYAFDITDHKHLEMELDSSQKIYEQAVVKAGLVAWEYDIVRRRIVMSDDASTRADYPKFFLSRVTENVPESLIGHIDDGCVSRFLEMYHRVQQGHDASCEVWYKTLPGQDARCERLSYSVMTDERGNAVKAYGIGQDITEQKREEMRYRNAYQRFAHANPDFINSFQINITENRCSSMTVRDASYQPLEKLMDSGTVDGLFGAVADTIVDEEIAREGRRLFTRNNLLKSFDEGKTSITLEYPCNSVLGGVIWVQGTVYLLRNPDTGDVEGITYVRDIDERKRDERIMGIIQGENLEYVAMLHVKTHEFELVNKNPKITFLDVGQMASYEECRDYIRNAYVEDDKLAAFEDATAFENIMYGLGETGHYTATYLRTEDEREICLQTDFYWFDDSHDRVLVVRSDVTATYLKEQERAAELHAHAAEIEGLNTRLQHALDEAERATAAEQTFLSSVSHDMRTPLNGILGFTDFALESDDPARTHGYLEKIGVSGRLMLDLVNDVLDMSKIESGKLELHPQAFEVRSLFESLIESERIAAEAKDITLLVDIDGAYPRFAYADRLRVQQIVLNLLSNAIKYTPEDGTVGFVVAPLKTRSDACNTLVRISDNGIGMSEEFQRRMFEPFAQEHQERSYDVQGTGLGLALVKRIVDLMGGHIEVESTLGIGTMFSVYLPIEETKPGEVARNAKRNAMRDIAGKRILICEDNTLNIEIAETILVERGGAKVVCAADGEKGVETFEGLEPGYFDAILMDVRMPHMDGLEATRAIRALRRPDAATIPIVAMTADAFSDDVQRCLDAGMNAHIAKPIDPDKLIGTLAVLIG